MINEEISKSSSGLRLLVCGGGGDRRWLARRRRQDDDPDMQIWLQEGPKSALGRGTDTSQKRPQEESTDPPLGESKSGPWTSPGGGLWTPAGGVFCNPVGAALGASRGPQVAPSGPQEGSRRASSEPVRPSTHVQNAFGYNLVAVLGRVRAVLGASWAVSGLSGGSPELSWSVRSSKTAENTGKPKTS